VKEQSLLNSLFSGGLKSESAWKEFLTLYSNLFLSIILKFTKSEDEVMEKYLFICSKLCSNNFRILKNFNPKFSFNKPKLSTWLTVVVRNLCVDEFRSVKGRRRLPKATETLNEFELLVFKLHFWLEYKDIEICQMLSGKNEAYNNVRNAISKIHDVLNNNGYGDYKKDNPFFVEFDENKLIPKLDFELSQNISELLELSINKLNAQQKVVLKLRFWEGLSPKEISNLLNINRRKVY